MKPPDNVLASLRVQTLDAAMMSQLNIPSKTTGVVVNSVETGSAAESAGLQRGDVIQEVNHEVIKSLEDYQKASAKVKKDEMVVLLAEPAREQSVCRRQPEVRRRRWLICRSDDATMTDHQIAESLVP